MSEKCMKRTAVGFGLGLFTGMAVGTVENATFMSTNLKISNWASFKTNMANPAVSQLIMQRQAQTVGFLGVWSACYQLARCALEPVPILSDPSVRTMAAFTICTFPFVSNRQFRRVLPWTVALTAMDLWHGGLRA